MKSDQIFERTAAYYRGKLAEHGPGAEGMDWKNRDTQHLRFKIIARYIDFADRPSILDVGCGSGEFLTYCQGLRYDMNYLGIDVCPEMVAACRERHGEDSARIATLKDFEGHEQEFDYAIASGTFNARLDVAEADWQPYFHANMKAMYRLSRVAAIVNMMTCYVDYRYDRLYYATPDEIGEFALANCSRDFIIDHSYPLYEMTAVFYRPGQSGHGR